MDGFSTPPEHIHFYAKKLFGCMGEMIDGAIAYLENGGGGPTKPHTHAHDHLFIVTQGEARVLSGGKTLIIKENEALLVKGSVPHSVWNNQEETTVMLGLSVKAPSAL